MVENLLSVSRMNDGKLNLNITTELIDDLIGEAVRHLGKRLDAFAFEWQKTDQLLFVRADARLIVQVILNLLDNAMKYTRPGSHIWIRTGKENGEIHVCVEDDGPGIPDDQKPHIFDLFYTSGNPAGDSRRGLGVGLALCQSILKAHDGRIWVTDRCPQGACFEFALLEEEVTVHE
jgi:two-component system sensor histidine kinase KdpD